MGAVKILPAIDLVSYFFQGFLIVCAALIYFDPAVAYAVVTGDQLGSVAAGTLFLVICFTLGQANSSFAHIILQQLMTKFAIGRPSHYFLRFACHPAQPGSHRPDGWVRRLVDVPLGVIRKPFTTREQERIGDWLAAEGYDMTEPGADREIFSRAFRTLSFRKTLPANFETVIFQYNFARNMTAALLIAVVFIALAQYRHEPLFAGCAQMWQPLPGEPSVLPPRLTAFCAVNRIVEELYPVLWAAFAIITLRFLYFFGVFTKNAIRLMVLEDAGAPSGGG